MTTEQKIIKTKVGILDLAKQLGNVSQACKIMGYSRDSCMKPGVKKPCGKSVDASQICATDSRPISRSAW
jgi:hypothetical protein